MANDSIAIKKFLGLSFAEAAPDHSGPTYFKNRLLQFDEHSGRNTLFEIFVEIILIAQEKGIDMGHTQIIDSTHAIADVNTRKEERRTKSISKGGEGKSSRDPDVKWGVKNKIEVKVKENGVEKIKETINYIFWFKSHFSVDAINNIITSLKTTVMNYPDNYAFFPINSVYHPGRI